jgi:hypothetical protein
VQETLNGGKKRGENLEHEGSTGGTGLKRGPITQKKKKKNKETEKERKSRGTTQRRGSAPPSSLSLHLRTEGDRI